MTKLAHLSLVALALSSLASARPLRLEPESPACPITLTACPSSSSGLLECIDTQVSAGIACLGDDQIPSLAKVANVLKY